MPVFTGAATISGKICNCKYFFAFFATGVILTRIMSDFCHNSVESPMAVADSVV